jgi:hypothetical protein|tara:strand:- start:229 stop:453 length:225 start_codon:yes stop_codon:yes gene_type:complete
MDAEELNKVWIQDVPEIVEGSLGKPISLWTVRSWCRQGKISSCTVGGRRYVHIDSLNKFLKGDTHDSAQTAHGA